MLIRGFSFFIPHTNLSFEVCIWTSEVGHGMSMSMDPGVQHADMSYFFINYSMTHYGYDTFSIWVWPINTKDGVRT